jgi:hypothetical protein
LVKVKVYLSTNAYRGSSSTAPSRRRYGYKERNYGVGKDELEVEKNGGAF